MNKTSYISVCFTYGGIRVFKEVIRSLDNPKFIRFSINKEGTLLAVEAYDKKSFTSFRVPKNLYSENGSMVVYSKTLCSILYNVMKWDKDKLYRIPGKVFCKNGIAIFDLVNATCYKEAP